MLVLKPEHLEIVRRILARDASGMVVWAYGSRVSGKAHDMSDLDLVVRNPQDLKQRFAHLIALRGAFRDSNLPISVDVMDWARIPQYFRDEIMKGYEVVSE